MKRAAKKKSSRPSGRGEFAWQSPLLTAEEARAAKDICKDPAFAQDIVNARLNVDSLPPSFPARERIQILNNFAVAMDSAAAALVTLPLQVSSCVQFVGMKLIPDALAKELQLMAIMARHHANDIEPAPGPTPDYRLLYAMSETSTICKKYKLRFSASAGPALDLLAIILRREVSQDQMKRARAHFKPRAETPKT